jgi:transcriptional regulator with XRE-family HTH domain
MAQRRTTPGFRDARYRALVEALRDRRRSLGLTQSGLADALGLHKQFVSRYELGERRLDAVEFADVARALGLNAGDVLEQATQRT